jgi:ferritin-like metal-binding protein YciE
MIDKSTDPQLATAFRDHLRQTEGHVASVEGLLRRAAAQSDRRC